MATTAGQLRAASVADVLLDSMRIGIDDRSTTETVGGDEKLVDVDLPALRWAGPDDEDEGPGAARSSGRGGGVTDRSSRDLIEARVDGADEILKDGVLLLMLASWSLFG
jgi:hypothetical protein